MLVWLRDNRLDHRRKFPPPPPALTWRWRQWRGYSRAALSRLAGVDPMVVSRLEARKKSGLEVETAAKLAGVCGWTLGQLCGLEPVPDIPALLPRRGPR